jgi:predicted PurR-regulated permease PerM
MLGIDRRAARYAWSVAVTALGLILVYLIRKTLFVFVLALLFAYLLSPLVNLLDRALRSKRARRFSLGLAYIIFMGVVALIGTQIGSRAVEQAAALGQRFPEMVERWQAATPETSAPSDSLQGQILAWAKEEIAAHSGDIVSMLPRAGLRAITVAGNVIYVIIVPILGFFFLKDGHVIRRHILDLFDEGPRRVLVDDVLQDIHLLLARYMRALVLLSLSVFTAYSIAFSIMHVPYAVLLASLAGMLEFIPMLGWITAGLGIVVVGAVSGAPVLAMVIFLLAYRIVQDYILSPQLMKQGVQLHPLLVLFGVFAGAELAGIPGMILSVPTLALARVVYVRIRKARLGASLEPLESTP